MAVIFIRTDHIKHSCKPNSVIPNTRDGSHLSCHNITIMIQRSTRRQQKANNSYSEYFRKTFILDLASSVVCPAPDITIGAVSSYLAFSPLPRQVGAVYFLWHFQLQISFLINTRVLPGTLFCEVRTFLPPNFRGAAARNELYDYSLKMKMSLILNFC